MIAERLNTLIEKLAAHLDDADLIDERAFGWKAANKRMRKTAQEVRNELKDFRAQSIEIEKS